MTTSYFGANCSDPGGNNDGVRCTFTMPAGFSGGAVWISEYSSAGIWAQVGMDFFGKAFFQVWKDGQLLATSKEGGGGSGPLLKPGDHTFEVSLQAKTKWHFLVDGKSQGAYDLGAVDAPSSQIVACQEGGDGSHTITLTSIMLRRKGVWSMISTAGAEAIQQDGVPAIGVYGHLQDPSLAPGSVRIGGAANIGYGTQLW